MLPGSNVYLGGSISLSNYRHMLPSFISFSISCKSSIIPHTSIRPLGFLKLIIGVYIVGIVTMSFGENLLTPGGWS